MDKKRQNPCGCTHTHTHTQVFLNTKAIFGVLKNRLKYRNKDPCYGLRLLYLRI